MAGRLIKTCFSNRLEECDVIRDLYDCMKTTAAEKTQELKMHSILMTCVYHYEKNADIVQTFSGN